LTWRLKMGPFDLMVINMMALNYMGYSLLLHRLAAEIVWGWYGFK